LRAQGRAAGAEHSFTAHARSAARKRA